MKKIFIPVIFILCSIMLVHCKVHTKSFNTWFWTSNHEDTCHLFIDNVDHGLLPHLGSAPECNDEELKKQALFIHLPSGNYVVEVKDSKGNIRYSEELRLKRSAGSMTIGSSTEWKESGSRGTNVNDCLIREIWY